MDFLARLASNSDGEWVLFGSGVLISLVLLVAVRVIVPRRIHPGMRVAIAFLLIHVALFCARRLAPAEWSSVRSVLGTGTLLFGGLTIGRLLFLLALDGVLGRRRVEPLPRIVRDIIQGIIYLIVGILALRAAGVEPGQLLTTSALLTAVVGLALQDTLGNLVAGLSVQIERPFEVGDWIEVHGQPFAPGRVREINWRATRLHTLDNVDVIVPNAVLAKTPFTNLVRPHSRLRRSVSFHASYNAPPRLVHATVLEAIRDVQGLLAEPPPTVVTLDFEDNGIRYWLRFFIDDPSRRDVIDGEVRDRIWYAFARAALHFPYPTRTLFMHEVTESSRERERASEIEGRIRALAKIDILSALGTDALARLAEGTTTHPFSPGETIIRQGEPGNDMFVVLRGELSVRTGEEEVARVGDGSFFGEMSLLTGEPRKATVVALAPCELLVVSHEHFHQVLLLHPDVADAISQKVIERQRGLDRTPESATQQTDAGKDSHDLLWRIRSFFKLGKG